MLEEQNTFKKQKSLRGADQFVGLAGVTTLGKRNSL